MPAETVKVMVRVRPMNSREKEINAKSCTQVDEKLNSILLQNPAENDCKTFTYDYVFGVNAAQQMIYENSAFHLVENVVEGYNGTIFAYGQTGCGKTFTMIGDPTNERHKGIIPRTFDHIIRFINTGDQTDKKYLVRCSYIEIYNEEIHDLLGKDVKAKMDMHESPDKGLFIKDLTINVVRSTEEMDKFMTIGTNNRSVGATQMNKDSSRSHCLFTVYIECSVTDSKGNSRITAGKLNLVDLAGSERQSKTKATGDRLKEATKINLSLSALGNVISALVDGKTYHIPYRDSKLTRLLQDSLGGNTKTIMIAAVSPADDSYEETLSTLRYASRAKLIKNQPKVNQDPKDALLREYSDEIKRLKELLEKQVPQASAQKAAASNQQGQQQGQNPTQPEQQQQMQKQSTNSMTQSKVVEMQKLLQNANQDVQILQKQKEEIELNLKQKDEIARKEKEEKEKLEALIYEKEQQLMNGGNANDDEKKKYSQMQTKLKTQKKEHEKLIEDSQKQQEELLKMEKNYNSLNEELETLRKLVVYLRKKYQEAMTEIKDLEKENENGREDLLDTIRVQDKENKFIMAILKMLLKSDEIETMRSASEWNDDTKEYTVPPFVLRQKKVNFPKLPYAQAIDIVEHEKDEREIQFSDSEAMENDHRANQFKISKQNNAKYLSPQVPKKNPEVQQGRGNESGMTINSALRNSNPNLSYDKSSNNSRYNEQPQQQLQQQQQEKRLTNIHLQPILDNHQNQLSYSPQPNGQTLSQSQLPGNSIFVEQQNTSMNTPGTVPKPNKGSILISKIKQNKDVVLQPMDRPPIPIPKQNNNLINNADQDLKRPNRQMKLEKIT